ncbi:MAG TPA: YggS family pyridoxal phosphate-dependent enzyme [Actinomycetota bacterium]|nr:YggS family pyridoxal phosphate-dependent enzyme [Actinomycetota bacterium]
MSAAESSLGVEQAVREVRASIEEACRRVGRRPEEVRLVAVTKGVPVLRVREALAAGVEDFGENYASELAAKAALVPEAVWHFIGRLQTGTAPRVADHARWVHSAEPERALERVARRVARAGGELRCLVQVDFTGRRQGVRPDDVEAAVEALAGLSAVRVVGLMTLPPWEGTAEGSRPYFRALRELRDRLRERWPELRELSMGMSGDYEVAVEEGATMVRIGTALFGPRPAPAGGGAPGDSGRER